MGRIHFTWISAAEGRKWQQVVTEITEKTRKLGPYRSLYSLLEAVGATHVVAADGGHASRPYEQIRMGEEAVTARYLPPTAGRGHGEGGDRLRRARPGVRHQA